MPLRTLIVIVLRLYAISYFVDGLSSAMTLLPSSLMLQRVTSQLPRDAGNGPDLHALLIVPFGMLCLAPLLWLLSSWLSRQITRGHETDVSLGTFTLEDLYRFAFIFIGLKFMLSSVGMSVQTGFDFFTRDLPLKNGDITKGRYLWPFIGHIATLAAGLVCLLGANKWTRLLIRRDEKLR